MLFLLCNLAHAWLPAQQTGIFGEPHARYRHALELFAEGHFGAARTQFEQFLAEMNDPHSVLAGNAMYYVGVSAYKLFHPDAANLLNAFVQAHPAHALAGMARLHMGHIAYRERRYREAARWYSSVQPRQIEPGHRDGFWFKKAYSELSANRLPSAASAFREIQDPSSAFYPPATYYLGHIAYSERDLDRALAYFRTLESDPQFGGVVPHYIVRIYHMKGMADRVLAYAPGLLEDVLHPKTHETARLVGEAHFHAGRYEMAIPYLQQYMESSSTPPSPEDHYQLGFAYLMNQEAKKAVTHLEKATEGPGELAQNASFHLASAYHQTGQKRYARDAFQRAHHMDINPEISRQSLFNYAKLSFELSYDPYNEAIMAFQRFIREYPDAKEADEAHAYLADLYLTTRNFRDALRSIEQIEISTPRLREAYQRITYYRGVELFNNGDFPEAIRHFGLSRRYPQNRNILAASLFWEAEAHYRSENYAQAISSHEAFLQSPGAAALDVYPQARYSMGYAHFKSADYERAIPSFRRFVANPGPDRRMLNDGYLRLADCYFITANYEAALNYYERAIGLGLVDMDYAWFQKAITLGVMGRYQEKVTQLQEFLKDFPRSSLADDAQYELGNTWLMLNNNRQAMNSFRHVLEHHAHSTHVRSAMLKTGLIHYNEQADEEALKVFREVIERYPGSPEAQEALLAMRNVYVDLNRVDEFIRFTENLGFADITVAQQDSLTYQATENRYMQGDCRAAIEGFGAYLDRFPQGIFSLNAHYYRAECLYRMERFEEALPDFRHVISKPQSAFTENALLRASRIEFSRQHYLQAYEFYHQLEQVAATGNNLLESRLGQMRSLTRLSRDEETILAAEAVIRTDKVPPVVEQEAWLSHARAHFALSQREEAKASFEKVRGIAANEMAAEAMYHLALIPYQLGQYEESRELIFDFVNHMTAYENWLARLFLLLADNYLEEGNVFQARHTLNSIIDNYQGEEVLEEARKKLERIEETQAQ